MKHFILLFLAVAMAVMLAPDIAQAQASNDTNEWNENPDGEPKVQRKRRRRPKPAIPANDDESTEIVDELERLDVEDTVDSLFLPDWKTPTFGWGLGPIVGFKYQSVTQERISTRTVQSEFGAAAGLTGVPLIPGNPGAYLSPGVGYAIGRVDGRRSYDETGDEEDLKYRYDRLFAKVDAHVFYRWYRHTLGLSAGRKINFQEDNSLEGKPENLFSASILNDFGVLMFPWISMHYTHIYRRTHFGSFDKEPFLREHDNWLHTRLFTSFKAFYIDIGPGFTNTTEIFRQGEPEETTLLGRVDYLKALSGLHLFWKLGASAHGKYVFNSTERELGNNSKILLPDQSLYETPRVVMPKDSFVASTFIGANNLFAGLGLGWQYNIQVLNASKVGDRERETTQDNGFVITYTARF